jgi:hypothetical protein
MGLTGESFHKSADSLDRVGNIRIGREWLRAIVEGEGRAVVASREDGSLGPNWQATDCIVEGGKSRVMAGMDGVMVPLITEAEKRKRRQRQAQKRKGKNARRRAARRPELGSDESYKEFKIGAFYDDSRQRQYAFATSDKCDRAGKMLRREAGKLRLAAADEKFSVSDGAKWIRRQLQVQLPMLDVMILDFYHFAEHVAAGSRACFGEGNEASKAWTGQVLEAARTQGPAEVLVKIQETLKTMRAKTKRAALESLRQYVTSRTEMLDYPTYRSKGWDIGSGVTEAFCKTLTARVKGCGMRWNRYNAEAIMALAALDHSNLWKTYWDEQRRAAA